MSGFNVTQIVALLIPIAICVVLPVAIVFIISWSSNTRQKMRTQVLLKAIENNSSIDADKLADAMTGGKIKKTPMDILNKRLLWGCVCTLVGIVLSVFGVVYDLMGYILCGGVLLAVGIGFLIVYFVTHGDVKRQMALEEKKAGIAEVEVTEEVSENN